MSARSSKSDASEPAVVGQATKQTTESSANLSVLSLPDQSRASPAISARSLDSVPDEDLAGLADDLEALANSFESRGIESDYPARYSSSGNDGEHVVSGRVGNAR